MKIAILGWGSLLWDNQEKFKEFNKQLGSWQFDDGPSLPLEFSRISQSRGNALTLVIDEENGTLCKVAYAFSKRKNPDDTICDLRCREGTTINNIGYYFADKSRKYSRNGLSDISEWAKEKNIDVVIWTDLESNFKNRTGESFSIRSALLQIQKLNPESKVKAAEYMWRAPDFINTPLRKALQSQPWFLQ